MPFPPSLTLPFSHTDIQSALVENNHITPFHLYSTTSMCARGQSLSTAFADVWLSFKNHYAVKALPNPHVLGILRDQGMGMDCSSVTELILCDRIGVTGEDIMFTSNNTTQKEFQEAYNRGAIINLDDISHIDTLARVGIPDIVCCRYNPWKDKVGTGIIWDPVEAKYGMRKDQILDAYTRLRDMWVQRFGLHAMLVSNERDEEKLIENARILFTLAHEIYIHTGIQMEWINLWGGIWVAYHPDHHEVDLDIFARGVRTCYDDIIVANNLWNPKIYMENGRYITAAAGCIVTRVTNIAEKHLTFVGLDASMADLMRPGMYTTKNPDGTWDQCYHHFTVIWKGHLPADTRYNVTGSLCENNDQFSRGVILPRVDIGDIVCIHTTGAHGQSMGFNYNGKLHSAEILMNRDNSMKKIRRAQTYDDLFIDIL